MRRFVHIERFPFTGYRPLVENGWDSNRRATVRLLPPARQPTLEQTVAAGMHSFSRRRGREDLADSGAVREGAGKKSRFRTCLLFPSSQHVANSSLSD